MTAPQRLELAHPGGLRLALTDLGATWMSCQVPLPDGTYREVLLGYDQPQDHLSQPGYLGATVGRYANRIAGACYRDPGGHLVHLAPNERGNQLHGGPQGFDRRIWKVEAHSPQEARFALLSHDGDQGFPGEVQASVCYRLDAPDSLTLTFEARTTRPTPLALTNHAYFNLDATHGDIRHHTLRLGSDRFVPVDAQLIPLGELADVEGTGFDFRQPRRIRDGFLSDEQQRMTGGYDHSFLLDPRCRDGTLAAAALTSSDGRVTARLSTDRPALQFYSGQMLATTRRRGGGTYSACQGLALEPGVPPDSPNRPQWSPWSDCFVSPGPPWRAWLRWQFSTT
jgi:aldose 1-epimerase